MDGGLKKELKKLEHVYDYERTVSLGRYVRRSGDGPSDSKTQKDTVHFADIYAKPKPPSTGFWASRLLDRIPDDPEIMMRFHRIGIVQNLGSSSGAVSMVMGDWIFLAVLGIAVAFLSSSIDTIVFHFQTVQEWIVHIASEEECLGFLTMYASWVLFFMLMIIASATFIHFVAPQAIGSGMPEMKTIIRGVILKDYLTFRTLVSKVVGLIFSLGSGAPIGKMGPFVHIASVIASQLCSFAARFDRAFGSETRRMETLTAACAVGVACTFSAPVGGVLFSIEVTTMYFSVRNYWRGFFASCCGAITIRLLKGVFAETEVTTSAFFQTHFPKDPYVADELPLFALLGIICGIFGTAYILLYKHLVLFLRTSQFAKRVFQRRWLVYPLLVSFILGLMTFPYGLGQFFTGRLRFARNLKDFYLNCTFSAATDSPTTCSQDYRSPFIDPELPHLWMLFLYVTATFFLSIVSVTLPIPGGIFMPSFVIGGGIGRMLGEFTSQMAPNGIVSNHFIMPGVYAVAGAASFAGAVTHSVSVSVIVFESTGQLHCILPVMISVIISNAISTYLTPSFFDTIIKIKHLPFLPDILPSNNRVHTIVAESIMASPVRFLCRTTTYEAVRQMLTDDPPLRIFPVVDGDSTQMLIGTVTRRTLLELLQEQVGDEARKMEAEKRVRRAIETIDKHFKKTQELTSSDPHFTTEMSLPKRTYSEGNQTLDSLGRQRGRFTGMKLQRKLAIDSVTTPAKSATTSGEEQKINRFLVTPTQETPPPLPTPKFMLYENEMSPESTFSGEGSPKRRNSFQGRRNACCSVEAEMRQDSGAMENPNTDYSDERHQFSLNSFHVDYQKIMKGYLQQAKRYISNLKGHAKKEGSHFTLYDLTGIEKEQWEASRLQERFIFPEDLIDPAPFQLVKRTSLHKIHSIFSMMQLTKAYVTDCGRVVGVVALCDVRHALENSQTLQNDLPQDQRPPIKKDSGYKEALRDVLTPAIEVIIPSVNGKDGCYVQLGSDPEHGISRPITLKLQPEVEARVSDRKHGTKRDSLVGTQAEEVVDAMAYLRRKSTVHRETRTPNPKPATE